MSLLKDQELASKKIGFDIGSLRRFDFRAKFGYGVFNRSLWTIFASRGFSRGPSRFPHFAQKRLSSGMCDPQYLQNITPTLSVDKTPAPSPHANPAAA